MTTIIGDWSLLPDPFDRGVGDRWFDSVHADARPAPVPGIIQQVFPDALGVAWYWSMFQLDRPIPSGHRVLLRFGAVDYRATVWVDGHQVGTHDNGETPFEFDITDAVNDTGPTLVAVRVVAPGEGPVDGLTLEQIPHRNKRSQGYHPGWLQAHGGILLPVGARVVPQVRIADIHAQPDPATGRLAVQIQLESTARATVSCGLTIGVAPDSTGESVDEQDLVFEVTPGRTEHRVVLQVPLPHLWDLDDPFLYRVSARVEPVVGRATADRHQLSVRCGFRELRIVAGYFWLNGRRILLRSSHTGNHFPIGQIVPPTRDMLRRDLINAKASGFNMVRFISGIAWPEQLDFCDEIGLMICEEPMGAWLLKDSPELFRRYDTSLREMVLRDRSHACVTIWGLLSETPDGRLFRHVVDSLALVRDLDPSRLVILNSGRFDAQPGIGSVSNPGSTSWEHVWGHEAPGAPGRTLVPDPETGWLTAASWTNGDLSLAGSIEGNGDTHTYPIVPHAQTAIAFLRGLGHGTKPHMLSEYGIGSLMNVIGETRDFEQVGAREDLLDAALIRSMAERFEADWHAYGFDDLYPFPEDLLLAAQRQHAGYRALGFDAVRSNPRIPGFNVTGLLDHALTGEGFWTFWRRWKPGIVDVLADGWAPLRWCLFASARTVSPGTDVRLEAVVANDGALGPGRYPARFRLHGPSGTTWEAERDLIVAGDGSEPPLAVPVLDTTVTAPREPGSWVFAAELRSGGRPAGGRLRLHVMTPPAPLPSGSHMRVWGIERAVIDWLRAHGATVTEGADGLDDPGSAPRVILVGTPDPATPDQDWAHLEATVRAGATVVYLVPAALRSGDDTLGRLPALRSGDDSLGRLPALRGRCESFYDWVYHREWVATRHPLFRDLPGPGLLDWDVYGPLLAPEWFRDLPRCDDIAAAAFAVGYSTPGGYASGIVAGSWSVGAGRVVLNAFRILPLVGQDPVADRLLINLVRWASAGRDA